MARWRKYSRGASTKTRIETCMRMRTSRTVIIQEAHPLKQGLKLKYGFGSPSSRSYSRGASTKTRIETGRNSNAKL